MDKVLNLARKDFCLFHFVCFFLFGANHIPVVAPGAARETRFAFPVSSSKTVTSENINFDTLILIISQKRLLVEKKARVSKTENFEFRLENFIVG